MNVIVDRLFLDRGDVTLILKVRCLGKISVIHAARLKSDLRHTGFHGIGRMFDHFDKFLIAGHDPDVTVSAIFFSLNRDKARNGIKTVNKILKIHKSLLPL